MGFSNQAPRWLATFALLSILGSAVLAYAQPEPRPRRRGRTYKVRIDSAPQKAAIYLEDKKYGIWGYTPYEGRLQKGSWKIILEADGYEPIERTIVVRRTYRVQDTFVPMVKKIEPALLDIRASADQNVFGAQVWVDNQLQGQIPVLVKVSDGRHQIVIKKDGFQDFTQWVEVKQGDRLNIAPTLKPKEVKKKGSILVQSDVPGAEVYIDGNKHPDTTPTVISGILEGPHVIEVRKEPAMPWKQSVNVLAGQTVKVNAELKATIGGPGGKIRVWANVEGAKVFFDGTEMGVVPIDIKDVKPGNHVIEVRAPGYMPKEKSVVVAAGKAIVEKFELQPEAGQVTVKIVSPEPEADVFVDGKRLGPAPQEVKLSEGDHFFVVQKEGFKKYETKRTLKAGHGAITITAKLLEVGRIRFLSSPIGAEVFLDGVSIGRTPFLKENVEVGDHGVTMKLDKHYSFEQSVVKVEGGKLKVVNAQLEMIDTGPKEGDLKREQRGLTSFGARTLPKKRSTIDLGVGYPYYLDTRITVGAGEVAPNMGLDLGVLIRSYLARSEIGVTGRLTLANLDPISVGVFTNIGGGSTFFDESGRNTFFLDAGGAVSLTGLGAVTVSFRGYANIWSDRHCPAVEGATGAQMFEQGKGTDTCIGYLARENGENPSDFSAEDKAKADEILDGDSPFDRESGIRFMASLLVEVAWRQRWNLWLLFEGAPFQSERPAFTNMFAGTMFDADAGTYVRVGVTHKF